MTSAMCRSYDTCAVQSVTVRGSHVFPDEGTAHARQKVLFPKLTVEIVSNLRIIPYGSLKIFVHELGLVFVDELEPGLQKQISPLLNGGDQSLSRLGTLQAGRGDCESLAACIELR
jgi:hypothetical protein